MSDLASSFMDRAPYFILWILTLGWSWTAIRVAVETGQPALKKFIRGAWIPAAGIFVLVGAVFCLVKPQFRVLSDESNLLAVSKAMASEARLDYVIEGYWQNNIYVPISRTTEIRPFGFPFAVHGLHLLTGFRPENALALNFILFGGVLCLIYLLVRRNADSAWALAAVFSVLAQPIALLCATSGGFEMFQLFWILVSLATFYLYWEKPQNEARFCLLWMSLIVLSHARYESAVFFLAVAPVLFFKKKEPAEFMRRSPVYALSFIFFIPLIWQRIAGMSYHPPTVAIGVPLWSVQSYLKNLGLFAQTLVRPHPDWPYDPLLNILGISSIVLGIWLLCTRSWRMHSETKILLLSFGTAAALEAAGLTAYAESGLNLPQSARYFLLGGTLLSVAAVFGIRQILGAKKGPVAVAVFAAIFLCFLPVAITNRHWNENKTNSEYRFVRSFLDGSTLDPKKTILIVQRPVVYVSQRFGGVSFWRMASDPIARSQIRYASRSGTRVFAVQAIQNGALLPETILPEDWKIHTLTRWVHPSGISWQINEISADL